MVSDLLAGLETRYRQQVVTEAARLLARLPDCSAKARAEVERDVFLPETSRRKGTQVPKATTYPLATMLLKRPGLDRPRVDELDTLRGWTLVAALRCCADLNKDDHFTRISSGLRVVRRLVGRNYKPDPLATLPELETSHEGLVRAIGAMAESLSQRGDETADRFRELRRLIADIEGATPARLAVTLEHKRSIPPEAWSEVRHDDGIRYICGPVLEGDIEEETYSLEESAEDSEVLLYDFGLGEARSSHQAISDIQAEFAFLQWADCDKGWIADYAALSRYECQMIWAAAWEELVSSDPDPGATWCAASLIFGRPISDLAAYAVAPSKPPPPGQSWWKVQNGKVVLCYAPDVSRMSVRQQRGNTMVMSAPDALSRAMYTTLADDKISARQAARSWLGRIGLQRSPDLRRLSRAISDGLIAAGEDIAITGLLCGRRVGELTQLYYASFPVGRLEDAWQNVQREWFGVTEPGALNGLSKQAPRIGTRFAPPKQEVVDYFRNLVGRVEVSRNAAEYLSPWQLMDRVAAETNLVAAVLGFLTARRPHGPAFEPLAQIIGKRRPRIRLGGKGNRSVDDGRWVPLVPAAVQALEIWIASVTNLSETGVFMLNPDLKHYIDAARAGSIPPLFEWKSLSDPPKSLRAVQIGSRVRYPALTRKGKGKALKSDSTDTPPNWARHYLRGALSDHGVEGTVIDGFMGHGGALYDPMRAASGASLVDQDVLTEALDAIWSEFGVALPDAV